MSANLGHYPPNPAYGGGTFRRRIAFTVGPDHVLVELLDDFHDMDVELTMSEGAVVHVAARMNRFPKSTCPGAIASLNALRGTFVNVDSLVFSASDRGGQCTHLADLARLGMGWFTRQERIKVIEVSLSDRDDQGGQHLTLSADDHVALSWRLQSEIIHEPAEHSGRRLFGGFAHWVKETFTHYEADLWRIAQMAVFVARGRAYIVDGPEPRMAVQEPARQGACYSYSGRAFETAIDNIGYVRDMSSGLPPRTNPSLQVIRRKHDECDRHNR